MVDLAGWITGGLNLVNQVLAATVVLTSFSLLIYIVTYNSQSRVARAFCALLAFVLVVYAGDVVLYEVGNQEAAIRWLKFQWIGIAFVPAAYFHFSDALLRTVNLRARWRLGAVFFCYASSTAFLALVLYTEWLVHDGVYSPQASHLAAGPLFWVFAVYFALVVLWGAGNIRRARRRALTRASRRRMAYLGLAFVAPALGAFPYLMLTGVASFLPMNLFQLLLLVGNIAVLLMLVLMAYSVAYFGALTPDRVVKHRLIHYLLRGPVVGAAVIFTMLAVPKVQQILGLRRDTVLIFAVVGVVVLLQLAINRAKPFIDRAIYRQDQEEIAWIQTLDRRLLTTADLQAFLENILAALCDLLQVRTGFVAVQAGGQHRLEAHSGDWDLIQGFLGGQDLAALASAADHPQVASTEVTEPAEHQDCRFICVGEFWLVPLYSHTGDVPLGLLGVEAPVPEPHLAPEEQEIADILVARAREALEDRYLQENVFETLGRILPDIERIHRWQDATRYAGTPPMQILDDSPIYSPEFEQWVRDALTHYWGGPRLTESPLLSLRVVGERARAQGDSPAQALRTVLGEAIERLRPPGERSMTTTEWILYNILELKFLRGLKVRDIARRLAMSESDLYRKQRVAIAEVARALVELERNGSHPVAGSGLPVGPVATDNRLDNQL